MTAFQWMQAVGVVVGVLSAGIRTPEAVKHFGEEWRYCSRLERQSAVLEHVDHPAVQRWLARDNEWLALNLVALRSIPYGPKLRAAVWIGNLWFLAAVAIIILAPRFGWGWPGLMFGILLLISSIVANYHVGNRVALLWANRHTFAVLGAPREFRLASRSMIWTDGKRRNIYHEMSHRVEGWKTGKGLATGEVKADVSCAWNEILDEQAQRWIQRGAILREIVERQHDVHPDQAKFDAAMGRLDRVDARLRRNMRKSNP